MRRLLSLLHGLFHAQTALHTGIAFRDGVCRWAIALRSKAKNPVLIAANRGMPPLRLCPPPAVLHADTGDIPVHYVADTIGDVDPDVWVTENEERIIPGGADARTIINEWGTHNNHVFSATIRADALPAILQRLPRRRFVYASLAPRLYDMARLYARYIHEPFALWRIETNSSLLGYVKEGFLYGLCTVWAGVNEIRNNDGTACSQVSTYIVSLTQRDDIAGVIIDSDEDTESMFRGKQREIPGYSILPRPEVPGIEPEFHEAWALACHEPSFCDFTPVRDIRTARALANSRQRVMTAFQVTGVVLCAVFLIGALTVAGIEILSRRARTHLEPVRHYLDLAAMQRHTVDSLTTVFHEKARFASQESRITHLLTEFQEVFPDGVWAENISVNETGLHTWKIGLTALSESTASIPAVLNNISLITGVGQSRMLYSEQTRIGHRKWGKPAVRFKLEAVYEDY